jgi:ketosteroid isomerase-like protein
MAEHPNVSLIRDGYGLFEKGDIGAFIDLQSDDVVWHVPGRNTLSGDYKGKQGVTDFITKLGTNFPETKIELHDILANDEHATAMMTISSSKDGKSISQSYVHVFHVKDSKITEFWELPLDQYLEDEFYSA